MWTSNIFLLWGIISPKHPTRSDQSQFAHIWQGRHTWAKTSSRSPSRIWVAMNNRDNREQSFLSDETWSWVLDFSLTGDRLKRGRLIFLDWVGDGSQAAHWLTCDTAPATASRSVLMTVGSARYLLSSTRRSLLSSQKGVPHLSHDTGEWLHISSKCQLCMFVCSWCLKSVLFVRVSAVAWNSAITLAISGPDTIQRRNAAGFALA